MAEFVPEDSKEYLHKVLWQAFTSLDIFTKLFIIISVMVITVTAFASNLSFATRQKAAEISGPFNLKEYYPNVELYKNNYLEGRNYVTAPPSRSVLWFEEVDSRNFKIYNSGPEDPNSRCHWDLLTWGNDGYLRYSKTHHECPGSTPNEIVYSPGIVFLPKIWSGTNPWSIAQSSTATYYENGQVKCQGVNSYTGKILGLEDVAPNEKSIHWQTNQVTTWNSGNVAGKCSAGFKTNWQEDYWLTGSLTKTTGGIAKGLKRSKGGNLDVQTDSWDIWFDTWTNLLPPTPTKTPTPAPNLIPNPGFENTGTNWLSPWVWKLRSPAQATIARDTVTKHSGVASARINITTASTDWYVQIMEGNFQLTSGVPYTIRYWARASSNRNIRATIQGVNSPYTVYFQQTRAITTTWQQYSVTFTPTASNNNTMIVFNLGANTGQVWVDDVSVSR